MFIKKLQSVLGFTKKKDKPWITPETWRKLHERRKAKGSLLSAKLFLHAASGAEKAATKGDLNIEYKITKQLVGGQSNTYTKPVKDKEEKVLTKRE